MNKIEMFNYERQKNTKALEEDVELQQSGLKLLHESAEHNYSFNFDWLSRPIIQYPQDIVAFQEIVWGVKPDLIIEMGIAHGGSLILSASLLALLDLCENGNATLAPDNQKPRRVIAVDIDIRAHNRNTLQEHPFYPRLKLIEGSSIDQTIINEIKKEAEGYKNILVCLDSNHTHGHVLAEMEAYAPLVTKGSYCIVYDTVIEDMPEDMFQDRPWGPGDSPKTAVWEFLKSHQEFEIDHSIPSKLLISVAPDGYLRRV